MRNYRYQEKQWKKKEIQLKLSDIYKDNQEELEEYQRKSRTVIDQN